MPRPRSKETVARARTEAKKQARKGRVTFDAKARKLYLASYEKYGLCNMAATAAGVTYEVVKRFRKKDTAIAKEFIVAEEAAYETYRESLVSEAAKRARDGELEDVYGTLPGANAGTGVVGQRRKKSDALLQSMLRRDDPKFREAMQTRKVDQRTHVTGSLATNIDTSKLDANEKQELLKLLQKAQPNSEKEETSD